jgi:hypothetical protein
MNVPDSDSAPEVDDVLDDENISLQHLGQGGITVMGSGSPAPSDDGSTDIGSDEDESDEDEHNSSDSEYGQYLDSEVLALDDMYGP